MSLIPNEEGDGETMAPVDKHRRYDRGIRVWGAHGQENLENARICLLNCGPTGSEALKNLVLGGIHSFTIVDGHRVQPQDLGNNYLVIPSALGLSRAQCVTECLKELNETVAGSFVEEEPHTLITTNPSFFTNFTLIIATQLHNNTAIALDTLCRQHDIPLIICRSYGLSGGIRNCVKEHCIVESKPDNEVFDLRVGMPWQELALAASACDLSALNEVEHGHVPYVILLVKAGQAWKDTHSGNVPQNAKERSEIKDLIRSWQRTLDGCPLPEENFEESLSHAHRVWTPQRIPREVEALFTDEAATAIGTTTTDFWIGVAALSRFVQKEGQGFLPLEGSLPDMHSTTQYYLELQRLYRDKAEADALAVERYVNELLKSIGKEPGSIKSAYVRHMCRHAHRLRVVRSRQLGEESPAMAAALRAMLSAEDTSSNASLYVLFHAVDRFYSQYQRYPGQYDDDIEEDVALLKGLASAVVMDLGISGVNVCDDLVAEIVRCGSGELQVVGAVVGAIASQEAIKIITKQYVPLEGTLIYNGMQCTTTLVK